MWSKIVITKLRLCLDKLFQGLFDIITILEPLLLQHFGPVISEDSGNVIYNHL